MLKDREIRTSINKNGTVLFAKVPRSKDEFLVMFKANDRCTVHRSRSYRVRGYSSASSTFDKLSDTTAF